MDQRKDWEKLGEESVQAAIEKSWCQVEQRCIGSDAQKLRDMSAEDTSATVRLHFTYSIRQESVSSLHGPPAVFCDSRLVIGREIHRY
jgi:hypothetical protein